MMSVDYIKSGSSIDLKGVRCPLNFIRCKLALERLNNNDLLYIYLDKGEPEDMVILGLQNEGHIVKVISKDPESVKLKIICKSE